MCHFWMVPVEAVNAPNLRVLPDGSLELQMTAQQPGALTDQIISGLSYNPSAIMDEGGMLNITDLATHNIKREEVHAYLVKP